MATGLYGSGRYGERVYGDSGNRPLGGVASGEAIASATLEVTRLLGGVATGNAIVTGALSSARQLAGAATGAAIASATLEITHLPSGIATGGSVATAFFVVALPVVPAAAANDMPGTVNLIANPSAEINLDGWRGLNGATISRDLAHSWDGIASAGVTLPGLTADEGVAVASVQGLGYTDAETPFAGQVRLAGTLDGLAIWLRGLYGDGTIVDGDRLDGVSINRAGVGADWEYLTPPPLVADAAKTLTSLEVCVTREGGSARQVVDMAGTAIVDRTGAPVTVMDATSGAATFWADAAQIEEDRGQGPTAFTIGSYTSDLGRWAGIPHRSVSIRQPIPMALSAPGTGGAMIIACELWRATHDNRHLEDLTPYFIDAGVTLSPSRDVTWTMTVQMTRAGWQRLAPREDWLAPILTVVMPDGSIRTGQMGLYVVWDGTSERDEWGRETATVEVDCRDPLWLLKIQNFPDTLRVTANTDKVRIARMILDASVLTRDEDGRRRYSLPDSGKKTKRDRDIPRDTRRLEIINRYLGGATFYPLWADNVGELRSAKRGRRRLKNSQPIRAWVAHLPDDYDLTRLGTRLTRGMTLPSEVVGPVREMPMEGELENEVVITNDEIHGRVHVRHKITHPNNPRSTWTVVKNYRGPREQPSEITTRYRKRSKPIPWPLVDDDADAREIAESLAEEMSTRNRVIEIDVLPDPSLDYIRQTCALGIFDARGNPVALGQWAIHSVSWSLAPSSGTQTMRLGRVDDAASILEEVA